MGIQKLFSVFQKAKRKSYFYWIKHCRAYKKPHVCFWKEFRQFSGVTLAYAIAKLCL